MSDHKTGTTLQQPHSDHNSLGCLKCVSTPTYPGPLTKRARDAIHRQCERSSAPLLLRNQSPLRPQSLDSSDSMESRSSSLDAPNRIPQPFPLSIDADHGTTADAQADLSSVANPLCLSMSAFIT